VGLVQHQQAAVAVDQGGGGLPEAGLGQHHADVGHHRLGQHAGHVARCQRGLQRGQVVELHHAGGGGQVLHLAQQAVALLGAAVHQIDEHVIHRAVVAAIEDQQGLAAGDGAQPAQHEAVGVGGRHRELPHRQAEVRGQLLAHHGRVFARQHRGEPAPGLRGQRGGHGGRRVAEHGAGVPQAEVHQRVAVHIGEVRALGLCHLQAEWRGPVVHPVQRHAEHQVLRRPARLRLRARPRLAEACALGRCQCPNLGRRDAGGGMGNV